MPSAEIILKLGNQAVAGIRQTADATKAAAAEEARAAQAALTRAQAVARLQVALGQNAVAERTLSTALASVTTETNGSIRAQIQLVSIQQRGATAASAEAAAQRQAMDAMRASVAPVVEVGAATQNATSYVGAFTSGLAGMAGPAAVAGGALALLAGTANSFKEAFVFKAQLDATNTSIGIQLHGVRDSSQAFAEASVFAARYRLTQQDTAAAIQASIPILRSSNASLSEVEATLLRLQVKKPEKSLADAARALDELKAGQIISIVDQFNVSRDAANKMKDEIAKGGDAVKVLSTYLTSAGIGMEALETRTKGAQGALNSLAVSQEKLKIAQAQFAQGPGLALLQQQIKVTDDATQAFGGSFIGLNNAVRDSVGVFNPAIDLLGKYNNAVLGGAESVARFLGLTGRGGTSGPIAAFVAGVQGGVTSTNAFGGAVADVGNRLDPFGTTTTVAAVAVKALTLNMDDERRAAGQLQAVTGQATSDILRSAQASSVDAAQKALQAAQTKLVADQNRLATDAFLALNPNMDASGAIAAAAAQGYGAAIGPLAALRIELRGATADQIAFNNAENAKGVAKTVAVDRFANRSGGRGDSSDATADAAASVAATKAQTAATEKTLDSEIALAAAKGQTAKQIDLLRQKEQLFGKDAADRVSIEAQIISLQTKGDKSRESSLNKQLSTHESIYDSINKQKDALLDIEELTIKDRQTDRDDAQKAKTAQAIIAGLAGRTDARSNDLRGRAEDSLALISVQDRQRAQQLAEKGATAGGTIGPNGKLLQSVPGGGALPPPPGGAAAGGALPPPPPGAAAAPLSATINLVVDGKVLASVSEPYIMDALIKAVRAQKATVGA